MDINYFKFIGFDIIEIDPVVFEWWSVDLMINQQDAASQSSFFECDSWHLISKM